MSVQDQASDLVPVSISASEVSIPGLYLIQDFISAKEEEVMNLFISYQCKLFSLPCLHFSCIDLFEIVFYLCWCFLYKFWSFISSQELLQAVDCRHWNSLAKRRVQHYGYEFRYDVSLKDYLDFSLLCLNPTFFPDN